MGSKFQMSPGVNVSEIDLTGFVPSVSTTGGAVVGQYEWGPVLDFTVVSDTKKLETLFGKPNDTNAVDWFSAFNFLAYSNNCNVIRVVGNGALNSSDDGAGELIKNETHYTSVLSSSPTAKIASKCPGDKGDSLLVSFADSATYDAWDYKAYFDGRPGTSTFVDNVGGENDEIHGVVVDEDGRFTGVPGTVLEKFAYMSKASDGVTDDGGPNFYGNVLNAQSSYVWFLGVPDAADLETITVDGEVVAVNIVSGGLLYSTVDTITVTVTDGEGSDGSGFDGTAVLAATGGVGVEVAINGAGTGYTPGDEDLTLANGMVVNVTIEAGGTVDTINSITTNVANLTADATAVTETGGSGNDDATFDIVAGFPIASVTVGTPGANYEKATVAFSTPTPTYGGTGVTATGLVVTGGDDLWNTAAGNSHYTPLKTTSAWTTGTSLAGGNDGLTPTTGEYMTGWDMFKNSEVVDVSLLILGSASDDDGMETVIEHVISNIAETRKDCVAFFSPKYADVVNVEEATAAENVIATKDSIALSTSYAFMDSGWKYQYDQYNDKYRWLPLNADTAGTCARTDNERDPWWSPAGYTRGQIKNVIKLAFNPSKTYRDELYKNNINPIVSFKGEGVILYGDRTLFAKPSAFQKLNVRRLFIVLEKAIARASKYLLFEFNDSFTRAQFVNMVEPFLREVKGRRGIYDFKVVCDDTNNTGEVIDRSEFVGDIYIKPAMSINFIQLNFIAVRTGVEFEEVVGKWG